MSHWLHVPDCWPKPQWQRECRFPGVCWTVSGKLFHRCGNDVWWLSLPPPSRLSWIRLYRLCHVVHECHDSHRIGPGLFIWRSYNCSILQWDWVGSCLLSHLAWGYIDLWWFGRIYAGMMCRIFNVGTCFEIRFFRTIEHKPLWRLIFHTHPY